MGVRNTILVNDLVIVILAIDKMIKDLTIIKNWHKHYIVQTKLIYLLFTKQNKID